MPFYNLDNMNKSQGEANMKIEVSSVVGEFMKVAIMTEPQGEGPPLHEHPNEEQFSLILEGQMHFILRDEDRVSGLGRWFTFPATRRIEAGP